MAQKKRSTFWELVLLIPCVVSFVTNLTTLIKYYTRSLTKNAVALFLFAILFALIVICCWLNLLILLCAYLVFSLQWNWIAAIALAFGLNVGGLLFIAFKLTRAKNNIMRFLEH